jgi:hypothetical protein
VGPVSAEGVCLWSSCLWTLLETTPHHSPYLPAATPHNEWIILTIFNDAVSSEMVIKCRKRWANKQSDMVSTVTKYDTCQTTSYHVPEAHNIEALLLLLSFRIHVNLIQNDLSLIISFRINTSLAISFRMNVLLNI